MTPELTAIDHIGIAVADLEVAVLHYRDTLGLAVTHRERVESQGVEEVMLTFGGSSVQLLGALGLDTPVGRFLASRGPGLHHVAYRVEDLAPTLEALRTRGVRLIDEAPRPGSLGTSIAFLHPDAMGGVLVELVQHPATPGV
jgi:methylmalonyl-CoA/ethylmalonyl-CoA epimerase